MLPEIASGLISGAGSLLGNLFGFGSTAATNKAQMKLAQYQFDKNLEMWNKNNEYNSPTAQMQRLSSAGLNPNLVYGDGAVGNASSTPPKYDAPELKSYQNFGDLGAGNAMQTYLAAKQAAADISYTNARTQNELAQTEFYKNKSVASALLPDSAALDYESGKLGYKSELLKYKNLKAYSEMYPDFLDQKMYNMERIGLLTNAQYFNTDSSRMFREYYQKPYIEQQITLYKAKTSEAYANAKKALAQADLSSSMKSYYGKLVQKLDADIKKILAQADVYGQTVIEKKLNNVWTAFKNQAKAKGGVNFDSNNYLQTVMQAAHGLYNGAMELFGGQTNDLDKEIFGILDDAGY